MTEWLLPVSVAATSLALTYFMCLRPMRHGRTEGAPMDREAGCCAGNDSRHGNDLENELARARAELAGLRGSRDGASSAPASQITTTTTKEYKS